MNDLILKPIGIIHSHFLKAGDTPIRSRLMIGLNAKTEFRRRSSPFVP
jgi:hypothetical protein